MKYIHATVSFAEKTKKEWKMAEIDQPGPSVKQEPQLCNGREQLVQNSSTEAEEAEIIGVVVQQVILGAIGWDHHLMIKGRNKIFTGMFLRTFIAALDFFEK